MRVSLDQCRWNLRGPEYSFLRKLWRQRVQQLKSHTNQGSSLALSIDGTRLYSGSDDNSIKVWDLEAGKEILTLSGHTGNVRCLSLAADGKRLYSGSRDTTVKVWDLTQLERVPDR
jgi:WD40 repeat protein